jgi:hypothetical protein
MLCVDLSAGEPLLVYVAFKAIKHIVQMKGLLDEVGCASLLALLSVGSSAHYNDRQRIIATST